MRALILTLAALGLAAPAHAHSRPHHHRHQAHARPAEHPAPSHRPAPSHHTRTHHHSGHTAAIVLGAAAVGLAIGLGPWSVTWSPAPRPGYVWISGRSARGHWVPGHWVPVGAPPAPHLVWVEGHWSGDHYVDGYWRDSSLDGHTWQDGHYDEAQGWVDGVWVPEGDVDVIYIDDTSYEDAVYDESDDASSEDGAWHEGEDPPNVSDGDDRQEIHALPPD